MTPPPPQPTPPQVVVVKQSSGCGKMAIILFAIAGVICLAIGGCFVVGLVGVGSAVNKAEEAKVKKAADAMSLQIIDFQWSKEGFGSVMEASFKIKNTGSQDLKDIEIECTHYAPSGTKIDSNKRTIYEIIKAGETREFSKFNMGFINSQVDKSVPLIISATPVK